jgi:predicted secreted protein with PEFG-CTERM motif
MKTGTELLNKKFGGFVLLSIMLFVAGMSPVFASPTILQSVTTNPSPANPSQSLEVSVTTDKISYNDGDKITISGSTQDYVADTPITIRIISPIGNIVKVDQVDLRGDNTYSTSITATGVLWQEAGAYTVKVQYGSPNKSAETTFQFPGSGAGTTMKVNGTNFSIKYGITNGKVLGMNIDQNSKSLIVSIESTGDGTLTVTLPRAMIDATEGGNDSKFIVINDGQESDFEETSPTTTDRTLSIPFTNGTTQIVIVGTFAIPEFGTIAATILVIAIASIIAISSRTARFFPKF